MADCNGEQDTIDKIDPAMYRQNVAVLAVMTYLLVRLIELPSMLSFRLPATLLHAAVMSSCE